MQQFVDLIEAVVAGGLERHSQGIARRQNHHVGMILLDLVLQRLDFDMLMSLGQGDLQPTRLHLASDEQILGVSHQQLAAEVFSLHADGRRLLRLLVGFAGCHVVLVPCERAVVLSLHD